MELGQTYFLSFSYWCCLCYPWIYIYGWINILCRMIIFSEFLRCSQYFLANPLKQFWRSFYPVSLCAFLLCFFLWNYEMSWPIKYVVKHLLFTELNQLYWSVWSFLLKHNELYYRSKLVIIQTLLRVSVAISINPNPLRRGLDMVV